MLTNDNRANNIETYDGCPWMKPVDPDALWDIAMIKATGEMDFHLQVMKRVGFELASAAMLRMTELTRLQADPRLAGLITVHPDGSTYVAKPLIREVASHPMHPKRGLERKSFFDAIKRIKAEVRHE